AQAEVIPLDVSPGFPDWLALIRQIRAAYLNTPLLAVSASEESLFALRTLKAGAKGYLMKREGLHQFVAAIRKVLSGQIYVNPTFGEQLIAQIAQGEVPPTALPVQRLTRRELEILRLLGSGLGTKQIAETLQVSHKTVESHRIHIKEKLGIGSAPELARFAASWLAQQGGRSAEGK
ncbi:MAG: response regulator transcription factor, partial [Verrucomicrobiaceae bacterium]